MPSPTVQYGFNFTPSKKKVYIKKETHEFLTYETCNICQTVTMYHTSYTSYYINLDLF